VKLFRQGTPPHQTALAMIGAKAGGIVVVIGASDPGVAAEVALVTGLNGRTLVIVPPGAASAGVEKAAAEAGALVDVETSDLASLPAADGGFDIAVVSDVDAAEGLDRVIREAARVVRPGGRVVVIRGRKVTGFRKLLAGSGSETSTADDRIISLLSGSGLRGARRLGQAEGVSYFEGTK
jgi:SAM-dependent methyltransferase